MAGTIIDSLVVTLGLDPTNFTKGQKEVSTALVKTRDSANIVAKELEVSGKRAAQFFSQVKTEALGLMGVLVGAGSLGTLIANTTTNMVQLGNAARNIGIPVGDLDAFGKAINRYGGSADAAVQSFTRLRDAANAFQFEGKASAFAPALGMLGLNPSAQPMAIMEALIKFRSTHKDVAGLQLFRTLGAQLQIDPATLNALLDMEKKGGVGQLGKEIGRSGALGVISPEMEQHAKALTAAWEGMKQAVEGFANVMVDKVSPKLTELLEWNTKMIVQFPEVTLGIEAMGAALIAVSTAATLTKLFGFAALADKLAVIATSLRFFSALGLIAGLGNAMPPVAGGRSLLTPGGINTPWGGTGPAPSVSDEPPPPSWWQRNIAPHLPSWAGGGHQQTHGRAPQTNGGSALSHQEFVNKYWAHAQEAGRQTGVDPRIILAQAAIESGWGEHAPGNNMFGIKGDGQSLPTREFVNGQWVTQQANFRSYNSPEESFRGYADFIKNNPRYAALRAANGLDAQLEELQKSGYATAPNYSSALRGTIGGMKIPAAPSFAPPPPAQLTPSGSGGAQNSWTNSTDIGNIVVHTQATDAHGIAGDIRMALDNAMKQSDRGLE